MAVNVLFLQEPDFKTEIQFHNQIGKSSPDNNKHNSKEDDINLSDENFGRKLQVLFPENDFKEIIIQKDNIISNLKSTLEVCLAKLYKLLRFSMSKL